MDLDRQLFEAFVQSPNSAPTLRIYQVTGPAITVGRSWRSSLRGNDVAVCIRPTGGGWVRHGNDFLYSVIARRNSFSTFHRVRTSYLSFQEVVQEAFARFQVKTSLVRCDDEGARKNVKRRTLEDCFKRPVPTDVSLGGQKIAGGAQWRRGEAFLHQGSVQLVEGVSFENFKGAFLGAFERHFGAFWGKIVAVG